jgi:penicillin-binding protein 2
MDKEKNEFSNRIGFMSFFFACVSFIIIFRLINIQIIQHEEHLKKLDSKLTTTQLFLSTRGKIYSRDGVLLAYDAPSYQLSIKVKDLNFNSGLVEELDYVLNPKSKRFLALRETGTSPPSKEVMMEKIKNARERLAIEPVLMDLSHISNIPVKKLVKEVQVSFENCLKRWAYLNSTQRMDLFINEKAARLMIQQPVRYSGFECNMNAIRAYPQNELASHLIGYMGHLNPKEYNILRILGYYPQSEDSIKPIILNSLESQNLSWVRNYQVGRSGVEKLFNNSLRGRLHKKVIIHGEEEIHKLEDIHDGNDIHLTIDYTLQSVARDALGGQQGSVVLIDMDTGDILVSVSMPSYDPNILTPPSNTSYHQYLQSRPGIMLNRSIGNHYPFGSVFKIITAAAAIEENILTPDKTYYCSKKHKKTGLHCEGYHSNIALVEALKRSCNIFFYDAALEMGPTKLYNWARKFHLGQTLVNDLPGEKTGVTPNRSFKRQVSDEIWYPGDTCHFAIGQGYQLGTPLQAAVVAGLISRPQGMVRPQFWRHRNRDIINADLSPYTREVVRRGLKQVVNHKYGTAYESRSDLITFAGKTGTADVYRKKPHSWFAGFAPYDNPKVAIAVIVENAGHGSDFAAPITKLVLEAWQQKFQLASHHP